MSNKELQVHMEDEDITFHDMFKELKPKQLKFLEGLAACMHNAVQASEYSGVSRMNHYFWLNNDEHYKRALDHLKQEMVNAIESQAYQMALDGQNVGMTIFALKAKAGWTDGQSFGSVGDEKPTINISLVQPKENDSE